MTFIIIRILVNYNEKIDFLILFVLFIFHFMFELDLVVWLCGARLFFVVKPTSVRIPFRAWPLFTSSSVLCAVVGSKPSFLLAASGRFLSPFLAFSGSSICVPGCAEIWSPGHRSCFSLSSIDFRFRCHRVRRHWSVLLVCTLGLYSTSFNGMITRAAQDQIPAWFLLHRSARPGWIITCGDFPSWLWFFLIFFCRLGLSVSIGPRFSSHCSLAQICLLAQDSFFGLVLFLTFCCNSSLVSVAQVTVEAFSWRFCLRCFFS
jgi:hypothetical protein